MHDKLQTVANAVTSRAGINVLRLKKHSPTIMFGVGVVGVVATAVLASKATLDLPEVLDAHENAAALIHELHEDEGSSDRELKKDLGVNFAKTTFKITKIYAPAFLVGSASIGLLTGSHITLNRRNAGLTAAYMTLSKGFDEYRARVLADVGEDKEREYRHGVDYKEIYSEGKKGEPVVTRQKIHGGQGSIYARMFNDRNQNWNPTPEYNLIFLKMKQNWLSDLLEARGYVTLNDVYDELGLERSPEGQLVGWLSKARGGKDGYIDFGIWADEKMDVFIAYMNGHENEILLDFNVDGLMYENI